jgi:1,4-dihydroxy-2-naphthoate octaprenyltransferase
MTEERSTHTGEQEKKPRPWRPTNMQALWAMGLVVALVTITLLVVNRYPDIWQDLSRERLERVAPLIGIGVTASIVIVLLAVGGAAFGWTGFADKTLWEWLQLLGALAIPVVLAAAGYWFSAQQDQRQQEIEDQRSQDDALQAFFRSNDQSYA